MGGALGSAVTGCDVVNGGGEASDNGAAKVILSTGVEGESDPSRIHWALRCLDRRHRSHWQKAP